MKQAQSDMLALQTEHVFKGQLLGILLKSYRTENSASSIADLLASKTSKMIRLIV